MITKIFTNKKNKNDIRNSKVLILFIILAYIFNVWVRIHYANYTDRFIHDGVRIIACLDGYYYGTLANENLNEKDATEFFPERNKDNFSDFTALISRITPFSINQLMAYLPIVISSLMVVPILLIGRIFRHTIIGFCTAIIVPICPLLYQRTLLGWYDTDMIAFTFPLFILYFLIRYLTHRKLLNILLASVFIILNIALYNSAIYLCSALAILTVFVLFAMVFLSKEWTYKDIYPAVILLVLSVSKSYYIGLLGLLCILLVFYIIISFKEIQPKILKVLTIVTGTFFVGFASIPQSVISKIVGFTNRGFSTIDAGEKSLKFLNVNTTIIETSKVPYKEFLMESVGSPWIGNLGIIGILLFVFNHRKFIICLPLLGLGIFSIYGGVRFAPYASFTIIFGFMYLVYVFSYFIKNKFVRFSTISIIAIYPFITAMEEVKNYKHLTPAFNKYEIQVLEKLKEISNPNDYAIAWWDYGYFIPFYANVKTIIDGGKHDNDNFIVSKILQTDSQRLAANFSRLAIEVYANLKPYVITDKMFIDKKNNRTRDPNHLLKSMKSIDFKLPKKTRDVYIYLPYHLLHIFNNVKKFGEIDLVTGKNISSKYLSVFRPNIQGDILHFSDKMYMNKKDISTIYVDKKALKLNTFTLVNYKDGKYKKEQYPFDNNSDRHVVYLEHTGEFLVMDNDMYRSLYIQLFFLKNYNTELFDLVIDTELVKIYRVKV